MLVPTKRTQPTPLDFALAIIATHPDLTKAQAGVLWAQYAGETQDGWHCYGHNYGNVKWTPGCGLNYHALIGTWECLDSAVADALVERGHAKYDARNQAAAPEGKKAVVFTVDNPITWFRNYPDAGTGMRHYLAMKQAGRFGGAWAFVLSADCAGFAKELGELKVRPGDKKPTQYFTASIKTYAAVMQAKHDAWMKSDVWERALKAAEPHVATVPIELADEGCVAVDPVTGVCADFVSLVDFAIVHDTPLPERESPVYDHG